jgi:very-short-patch-repair endonuclease
MPDPNVEQDTHAPDVILATHERLRREKFHLVSIIAGRRVSDSRAFVSNWLASRQRAWIVAPEPSSRAADAHRYWSSQASSVGCPGLGKAIEPWLLFVGQLPESLEAGVAISVECPTLPVAIATSADALLEILLDQETPPQLASAALQGLVSIDRIEDKILNTVVNARQLAPFLRSPYEGLIYYMLEARQATRGRFLPNRRVTKPGGKGSYEVDLVADDVKLIIEIDGAQHRAAVQIERDEAKQRDLETLGYRVRRFSTLDVSKDPVGVWHLITEQLQITVSHA